MASLFPLASASARRFRQLYQSSSALPPSFAGRCGGGGGGGAGSCRRSTMREASSRQQPSCAQPGPFDVVHRRWLSSGGYRVNGGSSSSSSSPSSTSGSDVVDSASATAQWKRDHYRKIEDKFRPGQSQVGGNEGTEEDHANGDGKPPAQRPEPIAIERYEDVQPMWKEMESRVTRRRSLTLEQRGGVSGRRNIRRSDEDEWLEAGVYDSEKPKE